NPASISGQSAHLLWCPPTRHQSSRFRIGEIEVAKLRNRLSLPRGPFFGGGVTPSPDVPKKLPCLPASTFGGPRGALVADREPTLAPFRCPVLQHVGDGFTLLPTRAKTGKR